MTTAQSKPLNETLAAVRQILADAVAATQGMPFYEMFHWTRSRHAGIVEDAMKQLAKDPLDGTALTRLVESGAALHHLDWIAKYADSHTTGDLEPHDAEYVKAAVDYLGNQLGVPSVDPLHTSSNAMVNLTAAAKRHTIHNWLAPHGDFAVIAKYAVAVHQVTSY